MGAPTLSSDHCCRHPPSQPLQHTTALGYPRPAQHKSPYHQQNPSLSNLLTHACDPSPCLKSRLRRPAPFPSLAPFPPTTSPRPFSTSTANPTLRTSTSTSSSTKSPSKSPRPSGPSRPAISCHGRATSTRRNPAPWLAVTMPGSTAVGSMP